MSQIDELQGRIAAALDRIGQGVDRIGAGAAEGEQPAPGELEALKQELEDERIANEQLRERVKNLQTRRQRLEGELVTARESINEKIKQFDAELQGLREANEKLREINARLREANEAGVGEPHLINKAMLAELEGLRATRAADRAETTLIYTELNEAVENNRAAHNRKE